MARFRIAIALVAGSFALVACNDLLGISDYEKVACDDGGAYCSDASFDAGGESGAIDSDAGPTQDGGPFDGPVAATDGGWASWPMPNPDAGADAGWPNAVSYVINGNGSLTDTVTRLTWSVAADGPYATAVDAAGACAKKTGGGWRVPTRIELVSLVDFTRAPAIDPLFTLDAGTPAPFWTASPVFAKNGAYWAVDFADGRVYASETGPRFVRCVRSAP